MRLLHPHAPPPSFIASRSPSFANHEEDGTQGLQQLRQDRTPGLDQLSRELMELILALVPVGSAVRASSVCKNWQSIVSSPLFASYHSELSGNKRPWFFLCGMNDLLSGRNQAFAFDPDAGKWTRLPALRPPPHDRSSLAGMNGIVLGVMGARQSKLCYTTSVVKPKWRETSLMNHSRCDPLVGLLGNPSSSFHKLIVAGGAGDADPFAVEMYDTAFDKWEMLSSMPSEMGINISCQWMSSAVHQGKFYVSQMYSGNMSVLDIDRRVWSPVRCLKPQGVIYSILMSCDSMLILAGVCNSGDGAALKLWLVDEATLSCKEIGTMPKSLFSLFGSGEDDKYVPLKCCGGGNLLYVYSDSRFKDYLTCVCELSDNGCSWTTLPSLPSPVNRFDRVVCLNTGLPVDACFNC